MLQLAASRFGDGGVDVVLANGSRVFVERYSVDLHGVLEDGEAATTEEGWRLVRQGDEVVCVQRA